MHLGTLLSVLGGVLCVVGGAFAQARNRNREKDEVDVLDVAENLLQQIETIFKVNVGRF